MARWFGDDIAFRRDSFGVDRAGLPMMAFSLRHVGVGSPLVHRLRLAADLIATGGGAIARCFMSHCISTAQMAARLGLDAAVCGQLTQVFTRWDGKGVPEGVAGEGIAPSVRLFHVANSVEVVHRTHGLAASVALARAWSGTQFAPDVVDAFCAAADEVLAGLEEVGDWSAFIEREPGLRARLTQAELDRALEAIADFTDLRSPSRTGHSRAVSALAARAAELSGLPPTEVTTIRRAALLHDLGMHGLPATISRNPGRSRPASRNGCA